MNLSKIVLFIFMLGSLTQLHGQVFGGLQKVQNAPLHAGTSRTFDHSFKVVLKAAKESMLESGLTMEGSSKIDDENYMMLGSRRANVTSWGEVVRIVVTREGSRNTTVRVLTQRRVKVNITAKADFSNTILSNIDMKLNL